MKMAHIMKYIPQQLTSGGGIKIVQLLHPTDLLHVNGNKSWFFSHGNCC